MINRPDHLRGMPLWVADVYNELLWVYYQPKIKVIPLRDNEGYSFTITTSGWTFIIYCYTMDNTLKVITKQSNDFKMNGTGTIYAKFHPRLLEYFDKHGWEFSYLYKKNIPDHDIEDWF